MSIVSILTSKLDQYSFYTYHPVVKGIVHEPVLGGTAMTDPKITCPSCSTEIKLTESLAAPLIRATRDECDARIAQSEDEVAKRQAELDGRQAELELARCAVDNQVRRKVESERAETVAAATKQA